MQTVTITVETRYFRADTQIGGFSDVSEPLTPDQARKKLVSLGIARSRFSRASRITSFRVGNAQRIVHINPALA